MKIALVGCGFVADQYCRALQRYPDLEVRGVYDASADRLRQFCDYHGAPACLTLDALLDDDAIEVVVNLTPPGVHAEISSQALAAGKHVYTEKPLALTLSEGEALCALAKERGLYIASSPCSLLSPVAQTLWAQVRNGRIGHPKLIFAELNDGAVHLKPFREWVSRSGAPWPADSEFRTGCTLEHAAYYLTWLTAMFGPVRRYSAVASCLFPDKGLDPIGPMAPDLSIGILEFEGPVIARFTCSIVAPTDRRLTLVGDDGVLMVEDAWDWRSRVWLRPHRRQRGSYPDPYLGEPKQVPLLCCPEQPIETGGFPMDFAAGIAELCASITEQRECRLGAEHALHVLDVTLGLQAAGHGAFCEPHTTFTPPDPMPCAS